MAETFTGYFPGVAFAATKNMAAVLNSHASEILKVRRLGCLNPQTGAVTGQACVIEYRNYASSPSLGSPTAITPVKHDSTNTLPTTYTIGHAGTIGGTAETLRRTMWSSDEALVSLATMDEFECFVPLNIIWDAGYGDSNVQPHTLRQTQMAMLYSVGGTAGLLDTWLEFTKE